MAGRVTFQISSKVSAELAASFFSAKDQKGAASAARHTEVSDLTLT